MNLPKTRREALAQGSKHFYTGVPCKNGHIDLRVTSGRYCLSCNRESQERFFNTPSGRAYHRAKSSGHMPRKLDIVRSDLSEVQEFYMACPPGYEVDHILPKHGKTVCGFDTLLNLQYLPKKENRLKHNKIDPFTLEANVCVLPDYREYVAPLGLSGF